MSKTDNPFVEPPSPRVVEQRIRNRIIEYLEIASSYDEMRDFEAKVRIVHVPHEVINMWEDCVDRERIGELIGPTYSLQEQSAIREFDAVWDEVAESTPDPMPALSELIGTEQWERLRAAALRALDVFRLRGRLDEERKELGSESN